MNNSVSISKELKKRRLEIGLSLSELARLADTSSATISRYENGWTRFEIGTLKKLALALKCELQISFNPLDETDPSTTDSSSLIAGLKRLFWDCDFSGKTVEEYPVWVTERVLELGRLSDVKALQQLMGRRSFMNFVRECTRVSKKTRIFWNAILRKEGMKCMKKSFRQTAWNS